MSEQEYKDFIRNRLETLGYRRLKLIYYIILETDEACKDSRKEGEGYGPNRIPGRKNAVQA